MMNFRWTLRVVPHPERRKAPLLWTPVFLISDNQNKTRTSSFDHFSSTTTTLLSDCAAVSSKTMKYLSTRGGIKGLSFADVLVSSYASDGGMYLPETIPKVSLDMLRAWADLSYEALCAEILYLYVGEEIELEALQQMTKVAFASFNTEKVNLSDPPLPLHQFGDLYLLDCSLGPTFAFKDIGQQIVAQLLNHVLERQGKRALILLGKYLSIYFQITKLTQPVSRSLTTNLHS